VRSRGDRVAESDIASSYATALIEALKSPEEIQQVGRDLDAVAALCREVPALLRILDNPAQPAARRAEMFGGALDRLGVHPATRRLLELALQKGRVRELPAIIEAFQRLREARLNLSSGEVVTAVPIEPGQKKEWEQALARVTGHQVSVTYRTDAALLGGALARVGSTVYDGSLRTQLSRIRERHVREQGGPGGS